MRNRCELLAAVFLLLRRDSLVKAIADVPLRLQAKVNMDYFSNLAKKLFTQVTLTERANSRHWKHDQSACHCQEYLRHWLAWG
jgi:hypothetical protein